MVFVRKKKIKGREYHYLVAKTRVDGHEQRVERYLGIHPPSQEDIKHYNKEFDQVKAFLSRQKVLLESIRQEYQKRMQRASTDERKALEEELITNFTYNTSRIEGSSLTLKDTKLLLQDNITPGEKPMRDVREAENHKQAFLQMKTRIAEQVSHNLILEMHRMLKSGVSEDAGTFRTAQVTVGSLLPIRADLIEQEIKNLLNWNRRNQNLHPLERACVFHAVFERIHPFFDGNGRVGRLLMNFILMQEGLPPIIIRNKNRRRYYTALRKADAGNMLLLIKYAYAELEEEMKRYGWYKVS
ncbi:MAG: Fic family protein [Nanoarchaeota archaeon]